MSSEVVDVPSEVVDVSSGVAGVGISSEAGSGISPDHSSPGSSSIFSIVDIISQNLKNASFRIILRRVLRNFSGGPPPNLSPVGLCGIIVIMKILKWRRLAVVGGALALAAAWLIVNPKSYEQIFVPVENTGAESGIAKECEGDECNATEYDANDLELAINVLEKLEVKGRAPKTGYERTEFYNSWPTVDGCNLRQKIIKREFGETAVLDGCNVLAGEFDEPYTGQHLKFNSREEISKGIQIDHVVALSDAWQKGAQYMEYSVRNAMATDPMNLLAVDASANQKKSDGDAATWLPANKKFRCQYVARQVSVKYKYTLWVTEAEKTAIHDILTTCPNEKILK